MERLIKLDGRPNKSVAPTKYFFKVPQVGRFIPLVGGISRRVESPLYLQLTSDWTFELLAMACNTGFSMLDILPAISLRILI